MGKRLTIQDIARLAGVSKATVSRVLNQKQHVDPITRERILKIVQEQSFVPSITASGLAGGRTRMLGVLMPALTWPMVTEFLRGVGLTMRQTNYELMLYSIPDVKHEQDRSDIIDRIVGANLVAGLLAAFPGPSVKYLATLQEASLPVVLIDDQNTPPENMHWVGIDNYQAAYTATQYLLQLGHRRIAHIQGPVRYKVSLDRYQGYCDALVEAGIAPDPELVQAGDFTPPSGQAATATFLALPEPPTAIFAASDYMAYGAITAASAAGLRIPHEISIVGFDDNFSSAHMQPSLTTIRQPIDEMGKWGMELLISLLEKPYQPEAAQTQPVRQLFPSPLMVRQSCGAPLSKEALRR